MPPQRQPLLYRASSSSDSAYDDGDLDDEELLQLSSSDSSAGPSPVIPKLTLDSAGGDEISKDLAELEELRRSVQKNLRLRPIRSRGKLPKISVDEMGMRMPGAFPLSAKLQEELEVESPVTNADPPTPGIGPAMVAAAAPVLAHAGGIRGMALTTAALTGGMVEDDKAVDVDGMILRAASGSSTNDMAGSTTNTVGNVDSVASASTTPTRLKPKLKTKTKGPPPALVLHDSYNSISTPAPQPSHNQNDTHGDVAEDELILPPRPPFAQTHSTSGSLGITVQTPISATSPTSSILSSYFTPAGDTPITSRFIGAYYGSPVSSTNSTGSELDPEESSSAVATLTATTPTEPSSTPANSFTTSPATTPEISIAEVTRPTGDQPQPIPAADLYTRLARGSSGSKGCPRPLVIDTRAPAAHVAYRIRGSVNIAIPSLILKRCRKVTASGILRGGDSASNSGLGPGSSMSAPLTGGKGGFQNMESLRQFLVGEKAKEEWSRMLESLHRSEEDGDGGLVWDGDVIVYDEEMGQDVAGTAWTLMEVLMPLVARHGGRVDYLEGGIMKGVKDTELEKLVEFGPMVGTVEEPSVVPVSPTLLVQCKVEY